MTPQREIYLALSTDAEILKVVSNDTTKISSTYPEISMFGPSSVKDNFPRITYVLEDRRHSFFTDNTPAMDELQFSVDIWLPSALLVDFTLNAIRMEIDRLMLGLGYRKISESEMRVIENRVHHLSLLYAKEFPSNL